MRELAEGVQMLRGFPPNAINVYLVQDVLIDAATRQGERRIMRQIGSQRLNRARAHPRPPRPPGGEPRDLRAARHPAVVRQGDVPAMETPGGISNSQAPGWLNRLQQRFWTGPPHPVARALSEGDEVAGFTVLEVPGHSPGHVAYWRESDRVLILGDVLNSMNVITGIPGLHEPPRIFTPDPVRNRESARRLAALRPSLALLRSWAAAARPRQARRVRRGAARLSAE